MWKAAVLYLWIHAWFWEPSRKDAQAHERSTSETGVWCLAHDIALEPAWVPTWANPTDTPSPGRTRQLPRKAGMSHCRNFRLHRPQASHPPTPSSKLDPTPRTTVGSCPCSRRTLRKLESSGAFSCSRTENACAENAGSQVTYVGEEDSSTPSKCSKFLLRVSKMNGRARKQNGSLSAPSHHAGLFMIPFSSLQVLCLDSVCPWDHDQRAGETNRCIEEVTPKDILDQNSHCPKTKRPDTGHAARQCATLRRGLRTSSVLVFSWLEWTVGRQRKKLEQRFEGRNLGL